MWREGRKLAFVSSYGGLGTILVSELTSFNPYHKLQGRWCDPSKEGTETHQGLALAQGWSWNWICLFSELLPPLPCYGLLFTNPSRFVLEKKIVLQSTLLLWVLEMFSSSLPQQKYGSGVNFATVERRILMNRIRNSVFCPEFLVLNWNFWQVPAEA